MDRHDPDGATMPLDIVRAGEPSLFSVALSIERLSGQLEGYQSRIGDQLDRTNDELHRTNDDLRVVRDELGGQSIRLGKLETGEVSRNSVKRAFLAAATFGGTVLGYVIAIVR